MRLILHTGAYWLLLDLRDAIPTWNPLRHTEFATIRLRLLKIAGRIIETASRIRIALASCCPEAETFSLVALKLQTVRTMKQRGADAPRARSIHPQRVDSVLDPINLPTLARAERTSVPRQNSLQIMRPVHKIG